MSKDKSEKRDKKEKKEKRSETDGVKKSKKEKKSKLNGDNIAAAIEEVTKAEASAPAESMAIVNDESSKEIASRPIGALVPFAAPLADEKVAKKVLKSVKKGANIKSLHEIYADTYNSCKEQDIEAGCQGGG
jgi:H/ACA ribonucleoprotein complex subunit 2